MSNTIMEHSEVQVMKRVVRSLLNWTHLYAWQHLIQGFRMLLALHVSATSFQALATQSCFFHKHESIDFVSGHARWVTEPEIPNCCPAWSLLQRVWWLAYELAMVVLDSGTDRFKIYKTCCSCLLVEVVRCFASSAGFACAAANNINSQLIFQ